MRDEITFRQYVDIHRYAKTYQRQTVDLKRRRKLKNELRAITPRDWVLSQMQRFYDQLVRQREPLDNISNQLMSLALQASWIEWARPYYKVWPHMLSELSHVDIDIPGRYLQAPFPALSIRLPVGHDLTEPGGLPVTGMLVCVGEPVDFLEMFQQGGVPIHIHPTMNGWSPERSTHSVEGMNRMLFCSYQFDDQPDSHPYLERHKSDDFAFKQPLEYTFAMRIDEDQSLEERLAESDPHSTEYLDDRYSPTSEFRQRLVRVAIATCFFGLNRHEVVMPDLGRKQMTVYRQAEADGDTQAMERVIERSKRYGQFGFNVGREIELPTPDIHVVTTGKGQPRGLTSGHVRRGHLRLQKKGPRDNPYHELVFIQPTVVRPDLPMRGPQGYRIDDDNLNRLEGATE